MMTDFRALCAELTAWAEKTSAHYFQPPDVLLRARAALADEPAEPPLYARQTGIGQWEGADHPSGPWRKVLPADLARWGNPAQPPADGEVAELVAEIRHFLAGYQQMRGLDPEHIYSIHRGDKMEAHITVSRLTRAAELLEREGWALRRLHRLHQENARFREPERTILCDILANGTLLPDPDGKRYGVQPADGEVAELVEMLKGIAYWKRHGKPGEPAPASFDIRQADRLNRAAELLQRLSPPQPVPVSERLPEPSECAPWPKDSDASAWCWMGQKVDGGWEWEQRSAGYLVAFPGDFTHWLPAHALPLPEVSE